MQIPDFSNYVSALSWRYGSAPMRGIFSEQNKYKIWRSIWVALAEAQYKAGLVSLAELNDLRKHKDDMDIEKILEIEKETNHDLVAAIREFAQKAKIGGGKIHFGATSMDIVDNADAIRIRQALALTQKNLVTLLALFARQIHAYANIPCMGYTHLQPAEPITVGYRLAFYAQDLLTDFTFLQFVQSVFQGKGLKGAVGTRASYQVILKGTCMSASEFDDRITKELGISGALITSQVYPRKYDYLVVSLLASIASSVAKFAGDLRILQSAGIGEWSEPFGKKQVGSSAMPFKRNPINCEKICSLARYVAAIPSVALENATLSYLERTLDDSANKRIVVAEGFLALDEILTTAQKIVDGLVINTHRIAHNVNQYAPFAATETLLIMLVKHGADRQKMHELLRTISMKSSEAIQAEKPNPMNQLIKENPTIRKYLKAAEIHESLDVANHVGDAPERALKLVKEIKKTMKNYG
ncbi:adenylosuccinate lyase [Candidatus Gottesmanbacteria bacterium]|nr:adenylosuccinate lyase [Candidatus Gottesmanbacteria bacterium]